MSSSFPLAGVKVLDFSRVLLQDDAARGLGHP